jgi:hypothetical protein
MEASNVSSVATTQETYDRFEAWLRENGAKFNMVRFVLFQIASLRLALPFEGLVSTSSDSVLSASNESLRTDFCSLDRMFVCIYAESRKGVQYVGSDVIQ